MGAPTVGAESSSDALARLRIQRGAKTGSSWFTKLAKFVFFLVLLLLIAAGGFGFAIWKGWVSTESRFALVPEMVQSKPEVRLASVTVVTGRSADALVVATGYLESRFQAQIGARAPGRIEVINVDEGTKVEGNQVLAVLEHADLEASLAATRASLARAKAAQEEHEIVIAQRKLEFERAERVIKTRSVAESEFDEAKFGYAGAVARRASLAAETALAEARVREAEQMKANMFILAPFKGTVISKDAEVGESILPGGMGEASGRGSVVTVADLSHLEVDTDVKEDFISRIAIGQPADVAVDAIPDHRYKAKVRKIIPMGDRARATIKVKVEIIDVDDRLFPEMSATVYFLPTQTGEEVDSSKRRMFIDSLAIQKGETESYLWILDDADRVQRKEVTPGIEKDGRTEIVSGLEGNERVVIGPPELRQGQAVKVGS